MSPAETLLACLALVLGGLLAWRCVPWVRALIFLSTLVISGLLFLPGVQLVALVGRDHVLRLERLVAATPWALAEWAHLLAFLWLSFLLWLGARGFRSARGIAVLVLLAAAAEVAQGLTPEREPKMVDYAVNLLGVAAGIALAAAARALRPGGRSRPPPP